MNSSNKAKTAGLLFFLITMLITSSTAQTKQETQDWIVEKLNYAACEQRYWNPKIEYDQAYWSWYRTPSNFGIRGDSLYFTVNNKFTNEHLLRAAEAVKPNYYCKCSVCSKYRSNQSTVTHVSIPLYDLEDVYYNNFTSDLEYDWTANGTDESRPGVGTLIIYCSTSSISVKGDITGINSRERNFYLTDYPVKQRIFYITIEKNKETEILGRLTRAFNHLKTLYPKKKEIF